MLEETYGVIYTEADFGGNDAGSVLILTNDQRWDVDSLNLSLSQLAQGGTLKIGFGTSANSPNIYTTDGIVAQSDIPFIKAAGFDNPNQLPLYAVWTGAAQGHVTVGYHAVKQDKKQWLQVTQANGYPARYGHEVLNFDPGDGNGARMFLMGGFDGTTYYNDVWSSFDGATWTQVASLPFTARTDFCAVVNGSKMYVFGGYDGTNYHNDTWSSSDGITWTLVQNTGAYHVRSQAAGLVLNSIFYLIGGYDGTTYYHDVWSSTDGITWTNIKVAAGFSVRSYMGAAVYMNKLWIYGGKNSVSTTGLNDVWSSVDGIQWIQCIYFNKFTARYSSAVAPLGFAYNVIPHLWLIGGEGTAALADIWNSRDGSNWKQENSAPPFTARQNSAAVVFSGSIWLTGGENQANTALAEVWRTNVATI